MLSIKPREFFLKQDVLYASKGNLYKLLLLMIFISALISSINNPIESIVGYVLVRTIFSTVFTYIGIKIYSVILFCVMKIDRTKKVFFVELERSILLIMVNIQIFNILYSIIHTFAPFITDVINFNLILTIIFNCLLFMMLQYRFNQSKIRSLLIVLISLALCFLVNEASSLKNLLDSHLQELRVELRS